MTKDEQDRKLDRLIREKRDLENDLRQARAQSLALADELARFVGALRGEHSWAETEGGDISIGCLIGAGGGSKYAALCPARDDVKECLASERAIRERLEVVSKNLAEVSPK